MKLVSLVAVSAILTLSSGRPVDHLHKREVPQEHSHNQFLAYIPLAPTSILTQYDGYFSFCE
jgi:hypothetical protein